ncbi:MAG: hypothetical protein J5497_00195 [Selenomonadaceae bacterium]|nr:hypothetical protein [Selenomonadaceae bacterium]
MEDDMKWRNITPEITEVNCLIAVNEMLARQASERLSHYRIHATNEVWHHSEINPIVVKILTPIAEQAIADLKRLADERKSLELRLHVAEVKAGNIK